MRRADKRNHLKQIQQNRKERLGRELQTYSKDGAYKIFTLMHLSETPVDFNIDLKYNYVMHTTEGMDSLKASCLIRCSDLLLLTVNSDRIDTNRMNLAKRFSPTILVIYQRKNKAMARNVSKQLGDASICESSMLNPFLNNLKTVCASVAQHRPYMLTTNFHREDDYLTVSGFMKAGLQTGRVVINGSSEGLVEEVSFDDITIMGGDLAREENEKHLTEREDEAKEDFDENNYREDELHGSEESSSEHISEYDLDEQDDEVPSNISPEFDLIEKYKGYRGVRNMATCTFKGQSEPDYYKSNIFLKNPDYFHSMLSKRPSMIPRNKFVRIKIRLLNELPDADIIMLFGLYEFESRTTILNYEFSSSSPLGKNVLVDAGHRIFPATTALSRNLSHHAFEVDPSLDRGVASFIGPFSFFSPVVYFIDGDNTVRGSNGFSQDRIFFEMVELRGKPMKVMKRHVVIRGMFYNREQVEYFSRVKLEAGHGNIGFIKKPLGTKGLFKAHFNQTIKHGDRVIMSLYKRVFL